MKIFTVRILYTFLWLVFVFILFLVCYTCIGLFARSYAMNTNSLPHNTIISQHNEIDSCSVISEEASSLIRIICSLEVESLASSSNSDGIVLVRDTSRIRYFAQRDLQGWQIGFEESGFRVIEPPFNMQPPALEDYTVLLCMGLVLQDIVCIHGEDYPKLSRYQRINQFYGMRQVLWRKDAFCVTMKYVFSQAPNSISSDFLFDCWVLPNDLNSLKEEMQNNPEGMWIAKHRSRGEGKGIMVVRNLGDLFDNGLLTSIVQTYLNHILLIDGTKFDLRTYVLITSITPLRAYLYKDGLVRLASERYNATGNKETQFLTNTSIGKKTANINDIVWMYTSLKKYLIQHGIDAGYLFDRVEEAIVKMLLASEIGFQKLYQDTFPGYVCENCYQLLGIDVIISKNLTPMIIEVNGFPSMQLSHDLGATPDFSKPYTATKSGLIKDTMNILFKPNLQPRATELLLNKLEVGVSSAGLCSDQHKMCLSPSELQYIIDSQREFRSKGKFKRIYPSPRGERYTSLVRHTHSLIVKTSLNPNPTTSYKMHALLTKIEQLNDQTTKPIHIGE